MKKKLFCIIFILLFLSGCYQEKIVISYNSNGGSFVEPTKINPGGIINTTRTSFKEGYEFEGWYYDKNFQLKADNNDQIVNDIVLYAKWKPCHYNISFEIEKEIEPITKPYLAEISLPTPIPKKGYYFHGWYTDKELTEKFTLDYMPLNGAVLYPKWVKEQLKVEFYVDGYLFSEKNVEYGEKVFAPLPSKQGYNFISWDQDLTTITESLRTNAIFKENIFTITYNLNNNDEIIFIEQPYLSEIQKPKDLIKENYVFVGWYTDQELTDQFSYQKMPSKNLTLFAKWDYAFTLKEGFDKTYTITKYIGNAEHLLIPDEFEGKEITSIDKYAFSHCNLIKEVIIGSNIKVVGSYAFKDCENIEKVIIDKNVELIGEGAFNGCHNIKEIKLPFIGSKHTNNTSFTYIFENYKNLPEKVEIYNITEIKENAFKDCENVKEIILPDTLTIINKNAFSNCYDLEIIKLPESVTLIAESAFMNCISLKTIEIEINVEEIKDYAFFGCTRLKEVIFNDDNQLDTLGKGVFNSCENLETIILPDNLKVIKEETFAFCRNLREIRLPKLLETINSRAFFDCEDLTTIFLPEKTQTIGSTVFSFCESLLEIYIPITLETIESDAFINAGDEIKVMYQGTEENWKDRMFNIDNFIDVQYIEDYSYYN